jgi:hypothetical protein
MRGLVPGAACLIVLACLIGASATSATVGRVCPATGPNGRVPTGTPVEQYGNGRLATAAYRVILANERTLNPDGSISEKYPWWGASSLNGELRITGKRLDRRITRTLHAKIDGGGVSNVPPGTHFWSTGITFPTTGCWRIDGRAGSDRLTLVVIVRRPRPGE